MPTSWGYSFALSDVRVTLANGQELDCLQKIHEVGPFIAAGFAGSVQIGFGMLETLYQLLRLDDHTQAWDPTAIAQWWPADARRIFSLFLERERALQSHLLVIGTHPTENSGGNWPRAYGHIYRSPDFLPEEISVHKPAAIGSGNGVEECSGAIDRISNNFDAMFSVMKGEQGVHGGMGSRLGFDLTRLLMKVNPSGVSSHLHFCWAYRGEVIIKTNNHSTLGAWSSYDVGSGYGAPPNAKSTVDLSADGERSFIMPKIAKTWTEVVELIEDSGQSVAGCVT